MKVGNVFSISPVSLETIAMRSVVTKPILFFVFIFLSICCTAQVKFKMLGGYNRADFSRIGKAYTADSYTAIHSFHGGAAAEIHLRKNWLMETGLLFFGNGTSYRRGLTSIAELSLSEQRVIKLYTIRVPVNLIYKLPLSKTLFVFAGSGLYVSRALWGREKVTTKSLSFSGPAETEVSVKENDIVFGDAKGMSSATAIKRYDFGYNFLAGIQWKRFQLSSFTSRGFIKTDAANEWTNLGSGYDMRNVSFSVSAACLLGKWK